MQQNEKRTKIILWAVVALAVIGCALWLLLPHGGTTDCTAEIWIDGQMVRGIYLPQAVDEVISLAEYGKGGAAGGKKPPHRLYQQRLPR